MGRHTSASLRALAPVLAVVVGLVLAAPAGADTFNVTTNQDTPNQVCPSTQCTLRTAVDAANSSPGADLINVPGGTYDLVQGALSVFSSEGVTIAGAGANSTVISGMNASLVLAIAGEGVATLTGVTVRDGIASDPPYGGNIYVGNTGELTLDHVRVTGGSADRGGGIAGDNAESIRIANSLIDGNHADGLGTLDGGGGIWMDRESGTGVLLLRDSTVAFNTARQGGGIATGATVATLSGVTLARNSSTVTPGGGLSVGPAGLPLQVFGSILAGNLGPGGVSSNCSGSPLVDGGGNLESGTDCGLPAAGRQNADPQLSGFLVDAGGQTPVLPIAATSPAIDIAPCTPRLDQRDVARPQGAACDAGAYEHVPAAAPPPPPPPPPPIPPPLAQPTPPPTPKARKTAVLDPVKGRIRVRLPGRKRYVSLRSVRELKLGTIVDARKGRVRLTSAANLAGKTQQAVFYGGVFQIAQTGRSARLITTAKLVGAKPRCKAKRAAASRKKRRARRLWGNGKGRFRTRGRYSSATVRGTKWLVKDTCAGTLTRVTRGSVSVRDVVKHKRIIVRAGKRYLARPRR